MPTAYSAEPNFSCAMNIMLERTPASGCLDDEMSVVHLRRRQCELLNHAQPVGKHESTQFVVDRSGEIWQRDRNDQLPPYAEPRSSVPARSSRKVALSATKKRGSGVR
jgi:hypothetical protein